MHHRDARSFGSAATLKLADERFERGERRRPTRFAAVEPNGHGASALQRRAPPSTEFGDEIRLLADADEPSEVGRELRFFVISGGDDLYDELPGFAAVPVPNAFARLRFFQKVRTRRQLFTEPASQIGRRYQRACVRGFRRRFIA